MRVFVYEFMTATGCGRTPGDIFHGMYLEGRAMRDAVAEDFARAGLEVVTATENEITEEEEEQFRRLASGSDYAFLIAPETNDILLARCRTACEVGARLFGPSVEAVRLTGSKWRLTRHWVAAGMPTPRTESYRHNWTSFPCVLKPDRGAGSEATYFIRDQAALKEAYFDFHRQGWEDEAMILQEFVPGQAASVAFLCGPDERVPLLPCFQSLSADGLFKYQGGELPIPPELAARAVKLATRSVECVPGLLGYVGVDLVLGAADDGSRDYAIEINPRLTTSYIGLRAQADFNIVQVMLLVATGERVQVKWKAGRVRFTSDGGVRAL